MTTRRGLMALLAGLATVPVVTACGDKQAVAGTASGATLGVADFATRIAEPGTVLLDVRTPAEFAAGHLQGARNVDAEASDFAAQVGSLDRMARYALYCRSGRRSAAAMQVMLDAGFTDVAHLDGGIGAWQSAGRPVTRA